MRTQHLTNSMLVKWVRQRPILDLCPGLAGVLNTPAPRKPARRCCGDGHTAPPPSAAKTAAALIYALPQVKKVALLDILGLDEIKGFMDDKSNSRRFASLVLASRTTP